MAPATIENVKRLREYLEDLSKRVDGLETPALLQALQEIEASGERSREDDGGPLTDLMQQLWRIRSAAYHAEQLALRLQDVPPTPESEQFQHLGTVEWVDPALRDHAYISARVWPGQDTIMLFLATDRDGDLDLTFDPDALERVITFLRGARDQAIQQAGPGKRSDH